MTLPHDKSGTEPNFEQSGEHNSEQLSSSFLPAAPHQATEREAVQQVVSGEQPVAWPPRGDTPLNESHSEGYITLAFPTLFPTGAADFTAPRMRPVTLGYYLKHLMMYSDGRFARHPRFRFFALNTKMRCVHCKLVVSTFVNTLRMHAFLWMSCMTWSVHFFPAMSVTTLVLSGEHVPTG